MRKPTSTSRLAINMNVRRYHRARGTIGSAVAPVVGNIAPQYCTGLSSVVGGGVAGWALSAVARPAAQTAWDAAVVTRHLELNTARR